MPNYERPASPIKEIPHIVEDEDGYCEIEDIRIGVDVPKMNLNESVDDSSRLLSATGDVSPSVNVSNSEHEGRDLLVTVSEDGDENNVATSSNAEGGFDNMAVELTSASSHIEVNDAYDSVSQVRFIVKCLFNQNLNSFLFYLILFFLIQLSELNPDDESTLRSSQDTQRFVEHHDVELCGTNRLAHAATLVPSVPCHLIAGIASVLNDHISRLMVS